MCNRTDLQSTALFGVGRRYEVREGFEIPCGRGNGWTAPFYYIVLFVVFAGEFTFVPYECACCIKFFSPLDAVLKEFL